MDTVCSLTHQELDMKGSGLEIVLMVEVSCSMPTMINTMEKYNKNKKKIKRYFFNELIFYFP